MAPFFGAMLAIPCFGEPANAQLLIAGCLMARGAWLHLTEQHTHESLLICRMDGRSDGLNYSLMSWNVFSASFLPPWYSSNVFVPGWDSPMQWFSSSDTGKRPAMWRGSPIRTLRTESL